MCGVTRQKTASFRSTAVALFMAASVLLMAVLSASPQAHAWWHGSAHCQGTESDHDSCGGSSHTSDEHQCGITLWAAGVVCALDTCIVACDRLVEQRPQVLARYVSRPLDGLRPFGRAPPACATFG